MRIDSAIGAWCSLIREIEAMSTSPTDSGIESENGHGAGEPVDLNMAPVEPPPQEQEKTLTDHLNKRLLASFLNRLDNGQVDLPAGASGPPREENEWEDTES